MGCIICISEGDIYIPPILILWEILADSCMLIGGCYLLLFWEGCEVGLFCWLLGFGGEVDSDVDVFC